MRVNNISAFGISLGSGMFAVLAIGAIFITFTLIFQWLWNVTMPQLFSLPSIRFWQSVRLILIAAILFGHHGQAFSFYQHIWGARIESYALKLDEPGGAPVPSRMQNAL